MRRNTRDNIVQMIKY